MIRELGRAFRFPSSPAAKYLADFKASLDDDLNIPQALACAWEAARDEAVPAAERLAFLKEAATVLGLDLFAAPKEEAALEPELMALVEARAPGAVFTGADMGHGSILMDSDFSNTDLSNVSLQGDKFSGANIAGANLKGADLRGAEELTAEQIRSATIDRETKLPMYVKINWISDHEYECRVEYMED